MSSTPLLKLNNGVEMPTLGLGVYQSPPEETAAAVDTALRDGYRLIDTAAAYRNEKEVGEGLVRSGVDRGDVFVTTKLWLSDYGYDSALRAFDTSLANLGLDYLDLYLLHQPAPADPDPWTAAYRAAEKLLADGRVRAIGVSNHTPGLLSDLMERTEVVPAVNQVELHPYFIQGELREAHARLGIVTQAWSPLGGITRYWPHAPNGGRSVLEEPVVVEAAAKYGRTPAQVVLRWHIEHGLCAIPKSVTPHRIAENFDVFDFALTPGEVAAIDALDTGLRSGPVPDNIGLDTFGRR
ncbi:oxidoreductase [Streptomyces albiflavescens]|uniref:Oxidoreductase n=1 Tax=Streptomyces albiflavescens TaxID=1623582 RepID=A0A917XRG0_9ACTN|nr:aldo/keto reductase [Streptomyces albiflavescens]GGN48935.1 oxidoreductase [Streptomyces albiflavescens]